MHPINAINNILGRTGRYSIEWFKHFEDICAFTLRLLVLSIKRPARGRRMAHRIIVEQIYFTAVQALPIIIPVALLLGTAVILQFSKVAGVYDVGSFTVLLLIREAGPLVTALIVMLRSGVAVTVEVSYMRILNEMEALEMMGVDPLHMVGHPRLVGIVIALLTLNVVFVLAAIFGGNAIAWSLTALPLENLLHQMAQAISPADIVVGVVKSFVFGVTIAVVALHKGFSIPRRMTAIPVACSKGAMETLFYVIFFNVFISLVFYL